MRSAYPPDGAILRHQRRPGSAVGLWRVTVKTRAIALSLLVTLGSLFGLLAPKQLFETVRGFLSPAGLAFASGIRLLFGVALFMSAEATRVPDLVRVLGVLIIVAGLAIPVLGVPRLAALIDWFEDELNVRLRAWCGMGFVLGLGLLFVLIG